MAFVRRLVERLETRHEPDDEELVVLDGMALTLPKTQRHGCAKFNNKTGAPGTIVFCGAIPAIYGKLPEQKDPNEMPVQQAQITCSAEGSALERELDCRGVEHGEEKDNGNCEPPF